MDEECCVVGLAVGLAAADPVRIGTPPAVDGSFVDEGRGERRREHQGGGDGALVAGAVWLQLDIPSAEDEGASCGFDSLGKGVNERLKGERRSGTNRLHRQSNRLKASPPYLT